MYSEKDIIGDRNYVRIVAKTRTPSSLEMVKHWEGERDTQEEHQNVESSSLNENFYFSLSDPVVDKCCNPTTQRLKKTIGRTEEHFWFLTNLIFSTS